MVEVLLFVNIGLLVIGSVTLTIAIFVLQKARDYVELAEQRLERLREGQERLFLFLREERLPRNEDVAREEEPVLEARQRTEHQDSDSKIEQLEKELRDLREARKSRYLEKSHSSRAAGGRSVETGKNVALLAEKKPAADVKNEHIPSTEKPREPSAGPVRETPGGKRSGFAVRHAHPDDDISLHRDSNKQEGSGASAPVKMFREHYRRYLENYEGYVKLAGRLYRAQENGEVPPGSPAEREWEQRLCRLNDGIQRTTARLDILEQYNPELASDDRISHRAEIAQNYAELEKKMQALENS